MREFPLGETLYEYRLEKAQVGPDTKATPTITCISLSDRMTTIRFEQVVADLSDMPGFRMDFQRTVHDHMMQMHPFLPEFIQAIKGANERAAWAETRAARSDLQLKQTNALLKREREKKERYRALLLSRQSRPKLP